MEKKEILFKNVIFGIIQYPVYLLAGGLINACHALFFMPVYLSYLRIKGINVLEEVDASWNISQIKNELQEVQKR